MTLAPLDLDLAVDLDVLGGNRTGAAVEALLAPLDVDTLRLYMLGFHLFGWLWL
eukprot:CAMPEP_0119365098 /NCGR_PEP_ID=MMETSP1334-20130426/12030_1 /TAXON_ID=127549 /ORGANISM="Calcidiscus leptoporus, Strain RCC1130" /LENGTH=53 /DNA_ID=CAMNT_0007380977 /DNA_START=11 /DNA_END=169 /DNA_ORIENTATION=-